MSGARLTTKGDERLDTLTAPVEVGRYYLVPTVRAEWYGVVRNWPVIGPQHNDRHCLNLDATHYHLDARFLKEPVPGYKWWTAKDFWTCAFGAPLVTNARLNVGGLPAPVWRRRLCRRLANPFIGAMHAKAAEHSTWDCHFAEWTGKQARHDGRGWICPHRAVSLADHPAVDGVITCPLHLLRIDAATGRVLPPKGIGTLSRASIAGAVVADVARGGSAG